jgi:phosphoserine phosphatase RsbU/P
MAELLIIAGPDEGKTFKLTERAVLGRYADCDFQIEDDTVSRHHAMVLLCSDGYYIEDLGSSNGTYVNGKEVSRAKLSDRDTIKLSHTVLTFKAEPIGSRTRISIISEETQKSAVVNPQEAVATIMRDSTTVENVDQLQDLHQKLLTMTRFSEAIRSTLELSALLDRTLELLFEIYPQCERGFIMLYDDNHVLRPAASRTTLATAEITVSSTVLEAVIQKKQAILSNNPFEDTRFGSGQSIITHGMRSLMAAPLQFADEILGVIHVDTTRMRAPFSPDDLSLFGGLAAAGVSVAIANARLHETLLRRQRIEQELTIAQTVQQSFLPRHLPQQERVELACHYAYAHQVGGDFYDVATLPDGRLLLAIGDVSGKGIPAALLMAKTISEMRVAAGIQKQPGAMLTMVNTMMLRAISPEMFVTSLACYLDPSTHEAIISDAGHNPPIVKRAKGEAIFVELGKGFPLGVVEDGEYGDTGLSLAAGDTLLFYTDGVTDASNSSGATFGPERLLATIAAAPAGARSVVDAVLAATANFVGLNRPFDDLTLVAVSPR